MCVKTDKIGYRPLWTIETNKHNDCCCWIPLYQTYSTAVGLCEYTAHEEVCALVVLGVQEVRIRRVHHF